MSETESEMSGTQVKLNNNSYISIGIVVLIVAATLWIKDGQQRSAEAISATVSDFKSYKEVQVKDAQILQLKLESIAKLVETQGRDQWTARDAKSVWRQFKALNPKLNVPDIN